MKRVLFVLTVGVLIGGAVAFSGAVKSRPDFAFQLEGRNPVNHLRWNLDEEDFQFAIVSDRTGGHRANIFAKAVQRLNVLQPAFVLSVGDLIEGGNKKPEVLAAEWKEFDSFVNQLTMPFFYVAGNHDVAAKEADKFWQEKLGRRHYHFLYRNVLFLILNTDDPPGSNGNIAKDQIAFAKKILAENAKVRWTIVSMHRPLWTGNIQKNGWLAVEEALQGRPYTVFVGHVHRFQKFVRHGQNYYQLATTGGGSKLRGIERGEFDHLTWVTMKKDGPLLAHIMLDSILPENLEFPQTKESGSTAKRKATQKVKGKVYFEGTPAPGAHVVFHGLEPAGTKGLKAEGWAEADGSFLLTTYTANDGAPAGEYKITVTWRQADRQGKLGANLIPAKYASPDTTPLRAVLQQGINEPFLELNK